VKVFPPDKIRNVALVGHSGSGKTTLAEALLFRAGSVGRIGTVEAGTTVTDYDPEEHARGISVTMALAPFEWRGHKVNLIDTPGYADFAGDLHAALRVVDLAVFVVSAVEGVEVQTVYAWRIAEELGVPRMIFVNKLDKERASFERTLRDLRARFGAGVAPIELPIGQEEAFHGVADLFRDKAYIYDSGSAEATDDGEMPEGYEIKGNAASMLYHEPDSRYYAATKAEVWFDSVESAEAAGFSKPGSAAKSEAAANDDDTNESAADEAEEK